MVAGGGSVRLAKPQRQHRIAQLLEHNAVTSQAQVVDLLAGEGVMATQATVSRDLEELGAVKVRMAGGETVYAVPEFEERPAPEEQLKRVFGEWVLEVAYSGNLVVLRTPIRFARVADFYDDFTPVSEERVREVLEASGVAIEARA